MTRGREVVERIEDPKGPISVRLDKSTLSAIRVNARATVKPVSRVIKANA